MCENVRKITGQQKYQRKTQHGYDLLYLLLPQLSLKGCPHKSHLYMHMYIYGSCMSLCCCSLSALQTTQIDHQTRSVSLFLVNFVLVFPLWHVQVLRKPYNCIAFLSVYLAMTHSI